MESNYAELCWSFHYCFSFWKKVASTCRKSAHPISAAIVSRAVGCIGDAFESAAELPQVKKFRNLPGIGIQGDPDRWLIYKSHPDPPFFWDFLVGNSPGFGLEPVPKAMFPLSQAMSACWLETNEYWMPYMQILLRTASSPLFRRNILMTPL